MHMKFQEQFLENKTHFFIFPAFTNNIILYGLCIHQNIFFWHYGLIDEIVQGPLLIKFSWS